MQRARHRRLVAPRSRELDALRRRFGMMFQDGALFSSLSVGENVATPLVEHARRRPPRSSAAGAAAHRARRPAAGRRRQDAERAVRRHAQARRRLRARWRSSPSSCSSTSRPPGSTRSRRAPFDRLLRFAGRRARADGAARHPRPRHAARHRRSRDRRARRRQGDRRRYRASSDAASTTPGCARTSEAALRWNLKPAIPSSALRWYCCWPRWPSARWSGSQRLPRADLPLLHDLFRAPVAARACRSAATSRCAACRSGASSATRSRATTSTASRSRSASTAGRR